jgi:hypothetical protein
MQEERRSITSSNEQNYQNSNHFDQKEKKITYHSSNPKNFKKPFLKKKSKRNFNNVPKRKENANSGFSYFDSNFGFRPEFRFGMISRKPKPEIMLKLLNFGHMYNSIYKLTSDTR